MSRLMALWLMAPLGAMMACFYLSALIHAFVFTALMTLALAALVSFAVGVAWLLEADVDGR